MMKQRINVVDCLDLEVAVQETMLPNTAKQRAIVGAPFFKRSVLQQKMIADNSFFCRLQNLYELEANEDGYFTIPYLLNVDIENSSSHPMWRVYLDIVRKGLNLINEDGSISTFRALHCTTSQLRGGGCYLVDTTRYMEYSYILLPKLNVWDKVAITNKVISIMGLNMSSSYQIRLADAASRNKIGDILVTPISDVNVNYKDVKQLTAVGKKQGDEKLDKRHPIASTSLDYIVEEVVRDLELPVNDGCGIISPLLAVELVSQYLEIPYDEALKHYYKKDRFFKKEMAWRMSSFQFRMANGMKGVLVTFDVAQLMKEYQVDSITTLFGDVIERNSFVDNPFYIVPTESQFKSLGFFKSIEEYMDSLNSYVSVNIECIHNGAKFEHQVTKEVFSEKSWLSILAFGEEAKEYTSLSYEGVQVLTNLLVEESNSLAQSMIDMVNDAFADDHAKARLLGQNGRTDNSALHSINDRIQALVSLGASNLAPVDRVLYSRTESMIKNIGNGKVKVHAAFARSICDVSSLILNNAPVNDNGVYRNRTLNENEVKGVMKKGTFYFKGQDGKTVLIKYPIVTEEEARTVTLVNTKYIDKWYPLLKNSATFLHNSVDGALTVFAIAGSDDDGDKFLVFYVENQELSELIERIKEDMPVVVSSIESQRAKPVPFTLDAMAKTISNTADNGTGYVTEIATYNCNKRAQVNNSYKLLRAGVVAGDPSALTELQRNLLPESISLVNAFKSLPLDEFLIKFDEELLKVDRHYRNNLVVCRIVQGGEIDCVKTGVKVPMSNSILNEFDNLVWREAQKGKISMSEFNNAIQTLNANPALSEVQFGSLGSKITRTYLHSYCLHLYTFEGQKKPSCIYYFSLTPMQQLSDKSFNALGNVFNMVQKNKNKLIKMNDLGNYQIPSHLYDKVYALVVGYGKSSAELYKKAEKEVDKHKVYAFYLELMKSVNNKFSYECQKLTSDSKMLALAVLKVFENNEKLNNSFLLSVDFAYLGIVTLMFEFANMFKVATPVRVGTDVKEIYLKENGEVTVPSNDFERISLGINYAGSTIKVDNGFVRVTNGIDFYEVELQEDVPNGVYQFDSNTRELLVPKMKTIDKLRSNCAFVEGNYNVLSYFGKDTIYAAKSLDESTRKSLVGGLYQSCIGSNITPNIGVCSNTIFALQRFGLEMKPITDFDESMLVNGYGKYLVKDNRLYLTANGNEVCELTIANLPRTKMERKVDYSALNGYICHLDSMVDDILTLVTVTPKPFKEEVTENLVKLGIDKQYWNTDLNKRLSDYKIYIEECIVDNDNIDLYVRNKANQEVIYCIDKLSEHEYALASIYVNGEEKEPNLSLDALFCIYREVDMIVSK